MDKYTIWVGCGFSRSEAFASICPDLAHQFMALGCVMNFPGTTPLDCKELEKLPAPHLWHIGGVQPGGAFASHPGRSSSPKLPCSCSLPQA